MGELAFRIASRVDDKSAGQIFTTLGCLGDQLALHGIDFFFAVTNIGQNDAGGILKSLGRSQGNDRCFCGKNQVMIYLGHMVAAGVVVVDRESVAALV